MTKTDIQDLIDRGYNVIHDGTPLKLEGDISGLFGSLQHKNSKVYVLKDLLKWSNKRFENLKEA